MVLYQRSKSEEEEERGCKRSCWASFLAMETLQRPFSGGRKRGDPGRLEVVAVERAATAAWGGVQRVQVGGRRWEGACVRSSCRDSFCSGISQLVEIPLPLNTYATWTWTLAFFSLLVVFNIKAGRVGGGWYGCQTKKKKTCQQQSRLDAQRGRLAGSQLPT